MALADALLYEGDLARHLASAQAFIRSLSKDYRAALSIYLGCEDKNGVLRLMHEPGFLSRGVVIRLCLWGWAPFKTEAVPAPRPQARESGLGRDRAD
jgi:hypothetical protein